MHAIDSAGPATILLVIQRRMAGRIAHSTADDLLQETLLRAWRARDEVEWKGYRAFRSWILTIADRCISDAASYERAGCRDVRRSAGFEGGAFEGGVVDDGLCRSTTPSRLAMYRERCDAMCRVMEGLPEEVREVVRLRLIEQQPLARIAELTGLTRAAVQHRVRRGAMLYQAAMRRSYTCAADSVSVAGADPASGV